MELVSVNISTKEIVIKQNDGALALYDFTWPEVSEPLDLEDKIREVIEAYQEMDTLESNLRGVGIEISLRRVY